MGKPRRLIRAGWEERRQGRYDEAEQTLLRAIAACREKGLRRELVNALKALAHVLRDQEKGDDALPLYEEAVALCREEGDPLLLAHTVRHLGDRHHEAGRLSEADACYRESLSLYRSATNAPPSDVANALRPAALVKEALGDVSSARELWSEARRHYDTAGVRAGVEECERHLQESKS